MQSTRSERSSAKPSQYQQMSMKGHSELMSSGFALDGPNDPSAPPIATAYGPLTEIAPPDAPIDIPNANTLVASRYSQM